MVGDLGTWRQRRKVRQAEREVARELALMPCGHRGWRTWMTCDLPTGHDGKHGTIIGRSTTRGRFVDRDSVTREMWT